MKKYTGAHAKYTIPINAYTENKGPFTGSMIPLEWIIILCMYTWKGIPRNAVKIGIKNMHERNEIDFLEGNTYANNAVPMNVMRTPDRVMGSKAK